MDKNDLKNEYKKGLDSSKIISHKQGITRAILQGTAFGIALFSPVTIIFKIIIFIILLLAIGALGSSEKFRGKI